MSHLQEWLETSFTDTVQEAMKGAMTNIAALETFEERVEQAEQLKALHSLSTTRVSDAARRVGETSEAYNTHLHMLLQAQDIHTEATVCVNHGDIPRAYELVKAVQCNLPDARSRDVKARMTTIPSLMMSLNDTDMFSFTLAEQALVDLLTWL